jgi:hypothetical protein
MKIILLFLGCMLAVENSGTSFTLDEGIFFSFYRKA